jgi:hypothetical protein
MNDSGDGLSDTQRMAVLALLSCRSLAAAARQVHCGESTLRRWVAKDRAFKEALAEARRQCLELALSRLQRAAGKATSVLIRALSSEKASDRIRSAVAILRAATAGAEALDLEGRVSELEQRIPKMAGSLNGHRFSN